MKTIYLAGPINGCTDHVANSWRNDVIGHFHHTTCAFRNPMDRDYRGMEDTCAAEIVNLDKRDIRESDVLLARVLKPTVGTSMEILYAYERDIPVILWVESMDRISPWLIHHATNIVFDLPDALDAIKRML